ncbi:hypothetical protein [Ralstonia pickettii]|uniref:hypothetical protein n=1 Tax=Ralstonia pickettii TaxID=329 RepID=UPI000469FFF9|nr:hypothetical protein [Ralstonia pickettii]
MLNSQAVDLKGKSHLNRQILHGKDDYPFTDKYLQPQVGTIARINQRTASVDCEGGSSWRVPFAMLHHVMDI